MATLPLRHHGLQAVVFFPEEKQARIHNPGIIMEHPPLFQLWQDGFRPQGRTIGAVGAHDLHGDGNSQNEGLETDFVTFQSTGIAGAVKPFVMKRRLQASPFRFCTSSLIFDIDVAPLQPETDDDRQGRKHGDKGEKQ